MKKLSVVLLVALLVSVLLIPAATQAAPGDNACWGQATSVFAQMGMMGQHASEQETPRLGLRNLARALYDAGAIPDDTMQALGAFVATEQGLSIDACMG
jgi:predicted Zn-dependent protease